jgi:environmental stress-induced protein Ves
MTTLIPFAGLSPVPWKNGGGSTTELVIAPPEAGFDDFDWRISLATIASDGPFSRFPGVDRTLMLVEGHGITLDIDGAARVLLCEDEPVACFDGAAQVLAKLNHGPTTDFNIMTRRARCHHEFGRRQVNGASGFATRGDVTVLFLAQGDGLAMSSDAERIGMVRYDAVVFDSDEIWTIEADQAEIFIVDIFYD